MRQAELACSRAVTGFQAYTPGQGPPCLLSQTVSCQALSITTYKMRMLSQEGSYATCNSAVREATFKVVVGVLESLKRSALGAGMWVRERRP